MLTFLSVVLTIYGVMHIYGLSKVWQTLPHAAWLGWTLLLWGFVMTLSPFILWQLNRQNWHDVTAVMSWLTYLWMAFLFLFCCTALLFDFGHVLANLSGFKWPLNNSMSLLGVTVATLALMGYGLIAARQLQVEE